MGAFGGKPKTYSPASGGSFPIKGIFHKGYIAVVFNGVETSTLATTLAIRLSDMPAPPASGDQVAVEGVDYRVIKAEDDGQGGSTLFLQEL